MDFQKCEKSPPIQTRLTMRCLMRFSAAFKRPARSRKSLQRADPIIVPKLEQQFHYWKTMVKPKKLVKKMIRMINNSFKKEYLNRLARNR